MTDGRVERKVHPLIHGKTHSLKSITRLTDMDLSSELHCGIKLSYWRTYYRRAVKRLCVCVAICRPSGCTVASGVVVVGVVVVVVGICNRSQMRTSKCSCLIFAVSIGVALA